MLSRLDLNLLRVFDLLMQERSVTRVAQELNLSQSTVSHSLNRLRQALDDPLFVLTRKEMQPTARARSLAGPVRQALLLLEQGLRLSTPFDPQHSQRIFKMAVSGSIEHQVVPALVEHLHQVAPNMRINIYELTSSDYEQELEKGELDLVIGFAGGQHLSDKLDQEPWFESELVCLAPRRLDLGEDGIITATELITLPHISTSSWGHSQILVDQWLEQQGLSRQIGVQVPGFLPVPLLLDSGRYLVVLPDVIARYFSQYSPFQTLRLANTDIKVKYVIASHPLNHHDPAVVWLKQQLRHVMPG